MRQKILISAFSCLPNRGSEPGVGWNWAIEAAKTQEVYVLTRTKCKYKIESELEINPIANLNFLYCDSSCNLRKISIYLEYIHWQWKAYELLKQTVKQKSFNYLIHLTFGNMFLPFWVYKLDIPFIWGPVGGGERVGRNMYRRFKFKEQIPHILKDFLIKTAKINPFILKPAKKSVLIISRTYDTKAVFPKKFHDKIDIRLETCINFKELEKFETDNYNDGCDLVYTGRLIALKNLDMLLDSFMLVLKSKPYTRMHLVGDGKQSEYLQSKVKKCNMENNVIFYGMLSRDETLKIVAKSSIYVFPSLKEGGAWSLMEAMALGKPVVCLKSSGMELITDNNSAIRIDVKSYFDMVEEFSNAILLLMDDLNLRLIMGRNAKQRIIDFFSWDCVGVYINNVLCDLKSTKQV